MSEAVTKFDDGDFNSFQGIACEGHTHTQRQTDSGRLRKNLQKTTTHRNRTKISKESAFIPPKS